MNTINECIKTFDDACAELGENHQYVKAYREWMSICDEDSKDLTAYMKLRIITAALNQGWEPDFTNSDSYKYYPWFCIYTEDEYNNLDDDDKERCCRVPLRSGSNASAYGGFVFTSSVYPGSFSYSNVGVRLAFKTSELALYAGKQFFDLWCEFLF